MRFICLGYVIAVLFVLNSCQNNNVTSSETDLPSELVAANGGKFYGDTLKVNSNEAFTSLFPAVISDIYSQHISSQIYEGLLKFNPADLSIEPCIAASYTMDSLNTEYTFKIRKNVFFHNDPCFKNGKGRAITSKDIQFVFEFLCTNHPLNTSPIVWRNYIQGANAFYHKKSNHVSGITIIDDYTISIKLNEPFSGFLNILALNQTAIFPEEALTYYGDKLNNEAAVGTGPFTLKSVGEHILLEKNRQYWKKDSFNNQLPFLSYVDIQFTADKSKELADFKAEKIDFIWGLPIEEIKNVIGSLEEAKEGKNKEFNLQSINNLQVEYYMFLLNDSIFSDIHLRKALNYAIDKDYIASYVLQGAVQPAKAGLIPEIHGYDKSTVSGYEFNVRKAQKELSLSKFNRTNKHAELKLYYNNSGPVNQLVARAIAKQLKENLGINLVLKESDRKTFFERIDEGNLPFWRYGWIADYPDPANFMSSFHSKNIKGSSNYSNKSQFSNATFDSYFNQAMAEPNFEDRMQLLAKAEQVLLDEAAIIPLFYYTAIRLVNPQLMDFPINELEFRDYSTVYFSKVKKKKARVYENLYTD
jgi:oligopeptide transport system substrate-binding protein